MCLVFVFIVLVYCGIFLCNVKFDKNIVIMLIMIWLVNFISGSCGRGIF